jgi:hypothetical protein
VWELVAKSIRSDDRIIVLIIVSCSGWSQDCYISDEIDSGDVYEMWWNMGDPVPKAQG